MPQGEDRGAAPVPDPLPREGGVLLPGERDRPAPALEEGARRRDGETAGPSRRLPRLLVAAGLGGMALVTVGWLGVMAGLVPDFPYLWLAIACFGCYWIGRTLAVRSALGDS